MRAILMILGLMMLILASCAQEVQQIPVQEVMEEPVVPVEEPVMEDVMEEPVPVEEPVEEVMMEEPDTCQSDIPPHHVTDVKIDLDSFKRTEDGFYLHIYPVNADGKIVPVTGSIAVRVSGSEGYSDPGKEPIREREGDDLFVESFYRPIEKVQADCSPEPVFVRFSRFDETKTNTRPDDDPGAVSVRMIIGSTEFQTYYVPQETGTMFLP